MYLVFNKKKETGKQIANPTHRASCRLYIVVSNKTTKQQNSPKKLLDSTFFYLFLFSVDDVLQFLSGILQRKHTTRMHFPGKNDTPNTIMPRCRVVFLQIFPAFPLLHFPRHTHTHTHVHPMHNNTAHCATTVTVIGVHKSNTIMW